MTPGADEVARALAATWEHLVMGIPGGWTRRDHGVVLTMTGIPLPTLNGVWPERVDLDPGLVAALLGELAATGLPHCLQLRPGTPPPVAATAAGRAMVLDEPLPLMVLEDPSHLDAAQRVEDFAIRSIDPADAPLHAVTAARGFGAPEDLFLRLMTPTVLALPGVRCYVGEASGQVVATGLGVTVAPFVAVLNIATVPGHRVRGYGAAVTARVVADGLAGGASWAYLQSSAPGFGVYTRLGFSTLERWDCWVTVP